MTKIKPDRFTRVYNSDGTITLYKNGKKDFRGTEADLAVHLGDKPLPAPKAKKDKPLSRAARWAKACAEAISALEELQSLQEEFTNWKDGLPENLQNSTLGEKLETICDLDIEGALSTCQEADGTDVPLGFGRD